MLINFRDRYLPSYAPPDTPGAAAAVVDAVAVAAAPSPVPADAAPAAADAASPAAPAADSAPPALPAVEPTPAKVEPAAADAAPAKPESTPSLLEAAQGKPKKEDATADSKASPDTQPAPADAAKSDADKDAKAADAAKPGDKAPEVKKDDAAKATDPAKEATAAEQPPAPVKYEAFKVPDGIKLEDERVAKFTEIVGGRQIPQEDAQRLIDLYVEERKQDVIRAREEQRRVWTTLNDTWKTELRKNPELGGNRLETTLSKAKAVIEEYLPPEKARLLIAHTTNNGMGNYEPFIELLHTIGTALNIFEDSSIPANPQAPKMPKTPGNRGWYDKSNMGNGAGA